MATKDALKIMFMGTPEFAVPSLKALVRGGYHVQAVVTQPDRPQGRGRRLLPPPVKEAAELYGLPVLQPERVRDPAFLATFRDLRPHLVVVAAFGQILPRELLVLPPLGCINVHPSLLPKYRGAAPINWTLIRGEQRTGVTIMAMDEGVDTGDILLQRETPIAIGENYDSLHERLSLMGAEMLVETVAALASGTAVRTPQDHNQATYAPRIKKEDTRIVWSKAAADIVCLIRGLSSQPGAFTLLEGRILKILAAAVEEGGPVVEPGVVGAVSRDAFAVAATDGWVSVREVQPEGKKRMSAADFLRGYRLQPGRRLD
ncbi:MAG: methionyl-tRNA formyltransferase [Syntrophales bacterium]|nr:methionyl-tRNA formyltransferase [Syntrophales bacterium]